MKNRQVNQDLDSTVKKKSTIAKEQTIAKKTGDGITRNKELARHLRKTARIASLSADISASVEEINDLSGGVSDHLDNAITSISALSHETEEEIRLQETLSDALFRAREAASETYYACEDIDKEFSKIRKTLNLVLDSMLAKDTLTGDIKKDAGELEKITQTSGEIIKRIQRIAERADVSGLNSSLEAGRNGNQGAAFSIVAEAVQKTASGFSHASDELYSQITGLKSRITEIFGKRMESTEKLRTISVMAKSIRNAFDDLAVNLDNLRDEIELLSVNVDEISPVCDEIKPAAESLLEIALRNRNGLESVMTVHEEEKNAFSAVNEQAGKLSDFAASLAGNQTDAAGKLYDASEHFTEIAEGAAGCVVRTISALTGVTEESERMKQVSEQNRDKLGELHGKLETILSKSQSTGKNIETFRGHLKDSCDVLTKLTREIHALSMEHSVFTVNLDSMQIPVSRLSRFCDYCTDFALRMNFFAVTGKIEVLRAGEQGSAFSSFPREFEAAGADAAAVSEDLRAFMDKLGEKVAVTLAKTAEEGWAATEKTIHELLEEIPDLTETAAQSAADDAAFIIHIVSGLMNHTEKASEKAATIITERDSIAGSLTEVSGCAGRQKVLFRQAIDVSEKLCVLADELYTEDE